MKTCGTQAEAKRAGGLARDSCLLAIDFLAMADAKDKNDQAVVFDLADEPVIAYTVFPELSKPRAVQSLSDATRIV